MRVPLSHLLIDPNESKRALEPGSNRTSRLDDGRPEGWRKPIRRERQRNRDDPVPVFYDLPHSVAQRRFDETHYARAEEAQSRLRRVAPEERDEPRVVAKGASEDSRGFVTIGS